MQHLTGAGGVKRITNYAPVLKSLNRARNRGFSYALYLDSMNKRYIEEFSSCNVFILKVKECPIPFEELLDADEVFCTGSMIVIFGLEQ
ncbi:branched-chain amino acid aminotransferase 1, mitochondrial isoform X2 [Olea europaea subsp. europaea]|uniref:Branched-chain amino acid aminotransferase 1, mitochondrial isoform X2 n=1 Tax=Olea europaea subsp. europaea TaxID=158383 RepID=A0A8S0V8V6_OLEEU|nr:branched-chain amino acid aminotransferase 1, mitochondrial isoform X2 [Olea europaea subsp. europaea]